jgi:hypothetical protein
MYYFNMNDKASCDGFSSVDALFVFSIAVIILLILPIFASVYYTSVETHQIKDITIDSKVPSTHGFFNNFDAYIITTDGEIYDVSDVAFARLKVGETYTIEWVHSVYDRTGTIVNIIALPSPYKSTIAALPAPFKSTFTEGQKDV